MLEWTTLVIGTAAGVLFAEYWVHGRPLRLLTLCVCVVSGAAAYGLISPVWRGGAFLAAMAIGQAAGLLCDGIRRQRQLIFPKLCFYGSSDMIWLPLCLCGTGVPQYRYSGVWEYAVYMAALLLCASLVPVSLSSRKGPVQRPTDLYPERQKYYLLVSGMPCAAMVPEILILGIAGPQPAVLAILMSAAFLLLLAAVLCWQRETVGRLNAEYMNRAMLRWQSESRDYMNTIRSQRHDFNLHLHAVSGLISSGRYEECRAYVQNLVSQANDVNDIMPVSDPVVGSMLYNMREKARRQGTDILYHITYDMEDILCNGFECNKIIGNLLQNAIDALQTPEDKAYGIRLNIFKRRGNTVIISENRFTGDPDCIARVFEPGYSTKKGHDGIGLSMILRTVQHYGGRVYPEFGGDVIRFVVNIPNKVDLQKGADT